jgi:alkanesulfonate monooxygenase SsuD/methylene tetrahydromethanopterin reductase-like flavin-dependent oxidoreductase (luciferase family)
VSGVYARRDRNRIRAINHHGDFYTVTGPLNIPRCPQGRPVLAQAGSSDTGRRFAARHADAVFTAHMAKPTAQEFYADLKALTAAEGRVPEHVLILPGLSPMIAGKEAEAQRLACGVNTTLPIRRLDASGCRDALVGTIFRTCRSIARWRQKIFPTPAWSRPRAVGPR